MNSENEDESNMFSQSCNNAHLKRKRRSSDHSSEEDCDIENLPTNDEKKYKDEIRVEASCSFEREGERRQPFSELKIVPTTQDVNIESLVTDQERLSLSEEIETASGVASCDVAQLSELSSCESEVSPSSSPMECPPLTPSSASYHEEVESERANILPPISWVDLPSLWGLMCDKDEESLRTREPGMFSMHPSLTPRMRAVLLDWIAEVCEVYRLHRETYYLTMDYIDRYLTSQADVPKQQLQLIGVTCLQLACKNEEIYPPKMPEFAFVTDGACTEKEIIAMETVVCKALEWRFNPITPVAWLKLYFQVAYQSKARHNLGFIYPAYSATLFDRVAHLLNLSTLDYGSLRYSYSQLAAAALYLACNPEIALNISGLDEEDLSSCINWMTPFWTTLKDEVPEYKKKCNKLLPGFNKTTLYENTHNMQKHDISLTLLDAATSEAEKRTPSCFLTPPSSSKKNCEQLDHI